MVQPQKAAVRPRGISALSNETILLEEEIQELVAHKWVGRVLIVGAPGSGKSTALRHLAAVLPTEAGITFLDEPSLVESAHSPVGAVQIIVAQDPSGVPADVRYRLASWTKDDLIEYLLHMHPKRCASVMARIRSADTALLQGIPDLWQIVLERLAEDDAIPDAPTALHYYLKAHLADTDLIERARSACLNLVIAPEKHGLKTLTRLAKPAQIQSLLRALRHPALRLLLAAERVAADLHGEADCDFLARRLPYELVRAAATTVREDAQSLERLHTMLAGPSWSHAMAASLLHAAGQRWTPPADRREILTGAYLGEIRWPGVKLANGSLDEVDFHSADLSKADLSHADVFKANLRRARLAGAILQGCQANEAKLDGAILCDARATHAQFERATLRRTVLDDACLHAAVFSWADLAGASFVRATLTHAVFTECKWDDADFTAATLVGAWIPSLSLRTACFVGADFKEANLTNSDLEFMRLPRAQFEKANLNSALLTGSEMSDGDFRQADLRNAGLAEVEWERADLRGADLSGASFHLGTTRSGLVGSPIACEGSRTGFYTDDFEEQTYKAPEEIRKANLCGADLRGARLDGVDFYLVDLRGARYDPQQQDHFRRCGAILEARV
jgi:uncharacterized protein YjbI with pentapeptide repeats/energy-coupling factor transporter ATP-binding protein EcfA2